MKQMQLKPRFIDEFPTPLEAGLLYVSMEYASTAHLCCCGCGHEVNLALSPRDWKMMFDGESVSLSPSVGNWGLRCRSHYVIDHNKVQWSGNWSEEQIAAGRQHDRDRKARHFREEQAAAAAPTPAPEVKMAVPRASMWRRFLAMLGLR